MSQHPPPLKPSNGEDSSAQPRHAFVTLVATDSYASGAMVLAHALRDHGTSKELACLVTPTVDDSILTELRQLFDSVIEVESLDSNAYENLLLLGRLDLGVTLTKIGLWRQTQYDKVVFLDADTLPLRNIDELFERPNFSAAPDAGWPDCFNSGVFVTKPNEATYDGLLKMVKETGSFDGGDQGLLNTYFSDWSTSDPSHRLPFIYNTTPTAVYSYLPAFTVYQANIAIVHFIGAEKPWHWIKFSDGSLFPKGSASSGLVDLVRKWWDMWEKYYGNASPVRQSKYDVPPTGSGPQADDFSVSRYVSVWSGQTNSLSSISDRPPARMPPLPGAEDIGSSWSAPHDISVWIDAPPVIENHYHHAPPPPPERREPSDSDYPFMSWNPGYEPPPDRTPPVNNLPDFGDYKNVWDRPFARDDIFMPYLPYFSRRGWPPVVEGIAPPPRYDPGMAPQDEVQRIFPWELAGGYEPRPSRIWLDEEAGRRARQMAAAAEAAAMAAAVADQGRRDSGYNEPQRDELRFVNAWDTMPSINKYLTRLRGDNHEQQRKPVSADRKVDFDVDTVVEEHGISALSHDPNYGYNAAINSDDEAAQETEKGRLPTPITTRSKSQMFAVNGRPKSGPTPYTSAATTPTTEFLPSLSGVTTPVRRSSDHGVIDLDGYTTWASDLKRPDWQEDEASQSAQHTDPDVTPPRVSPVGSPTRRHHARVPSGRSGWDPYEALQGVRKASIVFGEAEGPEASEEEGEEDAGALGLRFDRGQDDDILDPITGNLFLRRTTKEGPGNAGEPDPTAFHHVTEIELED